MKKEPPNPGTQEAIDLNCLCPIYDNHFGAGVPQADGTAAFWYTEGCPVHHMKSDKLERS